MSIIAYMSPKIIKAIWNFLKSPTNFQFIQGNIFQVKRKTVWLINYDYLLYISGYNWLIQTVYLVGYHFHQLIKTLAIRKIEVVS